MTLWTVANQNSLSIGISQARILEWVAISSSRGSSLPGNWTHVSCICRWILCRWATRKVLIILSVNILSLGLEPKLDNKALALTVWFCMWRWNYKKELGGDGRAVEMTTAFSKGNLITFGDTERNQSLSWRSFQSTWGGRGAPPEEHCREENHSVQSGTMSFPLGSPSSRDSGWKKQVQIKCLIFLLSPPFSDSIWKEEITMHFLLQKVFGFSKILNLAFHLLFFSLEAHRDHLYVWPCVDNLSFVELTLSGGRHLIPSWGCLKSYPDVVSSQVSEDLELSALPLHCLYFPHSVPQSLHSSRKKECDSSFRKI